MTSRLTIIITTYDRFELLKSCIASVKSSLLQSSASAHLKVVLNGQSLTENLKNELLSHAAECLSIDLVFLPHRLRPAQARNVLLQTVTTPWILFLDDDVRVPENFFSTFTHLRTQYPEAHVLGGPNLTPPEGSAVSNLTGWILQESLIVGPVAHRYQKRDTIIHKGGQFNLMLCNLFVERTRWPDLQFDGSLVTAEENHLLYELHRRGYQMLSSPDLFVWHERRSTLGKFRHQIFNYGVGRGQLVTRFLVLENVALLLLPFLILLLLYAWTLPLMAALLVHQLAMQARYFKTYKKFSWFLSVGSFSVWFFYGAGLLQGFFKTFAVQTKSAQQALAFFYRQNNG